MNVPSSSPTAVPSIHIHDADDVSALFEGSEMLSQDIYSAYNFVPEDAGIYTCSHDLEAEYLPPNAARHPSAELEDIPELSYLATTNQRYLTSPGYSFPYSTIIQDNGTATSADGALSPSSLGSPIPSPSSSFGSSLSPLSFYDTLALSDSETPPSPSPDPDQRFPWGLDHQSSESLMLRSYILSSNVPPGLLGPQIGPQRPRSSSSPSRSGPVASKAMLEANGRRRRHPAQFECPDCGQTFTALFSLRRHVQSHTGERPFACSIPGCTQRFFNSSDCKRHEKSKKRHKDLLMV